jgi:hypothetical protein
MGHTAHCDWIRIVPPLIGHIIPNVLVRRRASRAVTRNGGGITWLEDWRSRDFIDNHELERLLLVEEIEKKGLSDIEELVKDANAGLDIIQKQPPLIGGTGLVALHWCSGAGR